MTVKELKQALSSIPGEAPVVIGSWTEETFRDIIIVGLHRTEAYHPLRDTGKGHEFTVAIASDRLP